MNFTRKVFEGTYLKRKLSFCFVGVLFPAKKRECLMKVGLAFTFWKKARTHFTERKTSKAYIRPLSSTPSLPVLSLLTFSFSTWLRNRKADKNYWVRCIYSFSCRKYLILKRVNCLFGKYF